MDLSLATWMLIGLSTLLLAGLALLLRGLIGQRFGTDPHCRKCKYNLTGIDSDKCPECGRPASGKNVRIGLRKRRRPALIIGSFLLLISLGVIGSAMYARGRNYNWYPHLPTFALVQMAQGDDPAAIQEIVGRLEADGLQGESLIRLIPEALRQQGLEPRPRGVQDWTDFLAAMDLGGHLTQQQQEQFRDQLFRVGVKHRAKVRQGEQVTINVDYSACWPSKLVSGYSVENAELSVGDWKMELPSVLEGTFQRGISYGVTTRSSSKTRFAPGVYQVNFQATKKLDNLGLDQKFTYAGVIEIIPADAPSSVRLMDNPALAEQLRKAITLTTTINLIKGSTKSAFAVFEVVKTGPIPIDGAFELVVRMADHEESVGPVRFPKDDATTLKQTLSRRIKLSGGDSFVPVLRTSTLVAEDTHMELDAELGAPDPMFEIWDGELIFDPVSWHQPQPEISAQDTVEESNPPSQPR